MLGLDLPNRDQQDHNQAKAKKRSHPLDNCFRKRIQEKLFHWIGPP
jgi:hypothetical protein